MKKILDWESSEVVNILDEVSLWSAPFGRLLLDNIPMMPEARVVDIGFGTGFPLIELSQRFGEQSKIYGIDIWESGIERARKKISTLEISNIKIIGESAETINIGDKQIDLVTSNLGVNNFERKEVIYLEIKRILKRGGRLSITTNPIGTFSELFEVFSAILKEMNLKEEQNRLADYINHRNTENGIIKEIRKSGLKLIKRKADSSNFRFVDAEALINHSLIRVGFRASWENMVEEENRAIFFKRLILKINKMIESKGEFQMSVPMLYLEFGKD